jgi:hypothetical protein
MSKPKRSPVSDKRRAPSDVFQHWQAGAYIYGEMLRSAQHDIGICAPDLGEAALGVLFQFGENELGDFLESVENSLALDSDCFQNGFALHH